MKYIVHNHPKISTTIDSVCSYMDDFACEGNYLGIMEETILCDSITWQLDTLAR